MDHRPYLPHSRKSDPQIAMFRNRIPKSGRKKESGRFRASCRRFISFLYGLTRDPPRSRISVFLVKYFIWFYYPGLASCPPHYAVTSEKNENDDYSRQGAYHINYRHRLGNTPATNNGHVSENNDHLVHSAHYTDVLRDEIHAGIYLLDP